MKRERKTHEFILPAARFDVDTMMLKSGITGYSCNTNNDWHTNVLVGDYVLLLKGPELEEKMLLEVVDKKEVENPYYSSVPLKAEYNNDDSNGIKEFEKYLANELSNVKSFINMQFSIVQDLTKTNESKKLVKNKI